MRAHAVCMYTHVYVSVCDICVRICLSCVRLCDWTVACQVPLSMGFSRQEIMEWEAISFSKGSS